MGLKADRLILEYDIHNMMNEVATRGVVVCLASGASGIALGDRDQVATVKAFASGGIPLGVLLDDVVNIDTTKFHVNPHKGEIQKGGKVTIARKGWFLTNNIHGTPAVGDKAYLEASGRFSAVEIGTAQTPLVGRFLTKKDSDGYCKVEINIP